MMVSKFQKKKFVIAVHANLKLFTATKTIFS